MIVRPQAAVCVLAVVIVAAGCSKPGIDPALTPLRAHVAALEQRKTLLEDVNAIERLQGAYGYYLDRGLWDEVANLFANDGTIEVALDGVYVGKQRVREYVYALGGGCQGLPAGVLDEHLQVMPVISDDRYNTVAYRYGFLPCPDPEAKPGTGGACYARFDHQTKKATLFNAGTESSLAECCFAPRSATAPEGSGYLMGVATRNTEGGRSCDPRCRASERRAVATVHLPMRAIGQIHGWWVPEAQLPKA